MVQSKIKIAILGLGPIGSIIAHSLYQSGTECELIFIDLPLRINQFMQHGLLIGDKPAYHPKKEQLMDSLTKLEENSLDILCLCTKANSLSGILPIITNKISEKTLLVSIQNGIGPEDLIQVAFPKNPVARMVVNFAGSIEGDKGKVSMNWFHPPNILGLITPDSSKEHLEWLTETLGQGGLASETVSGIEIKKKAFFKAILNSALSPLCALSDLTMSQAMEASCRPLVSQILEEGLAVAQKLGFDYGPNALTQCLGYLEKGGHHYPSMWHDLHGHRMSEIDFINGRIVELGHHYGVPVPHNFMLTALMVSKEIHILARSSDNMPAYLKMAYI